ncbi:MAG: hypothetical protein AAB250_12560 [Bdellovibrionota bacterium]
MRTILATTALTALTLTASLDARAGTWHCEAGLTDTTSVVTIEVEGDELGTIADHAKVTIAQFPASYISRNDTPETDELARLVIGEDDPRSHLRLRLMNEMFDESTHKAFVLLVNMPLKRELDGFCGYTN